jgi:hypothetical protein
MVAQIGIEKQIPFGNDRKKHRYNSKNNGREQQIPFGNDRKKSKGNGMVARD